MISNFKQGLTLVEVMIALLVISLGVLAGVELMARVVKADAEQSAWANWENKLMTAREKINVMSADDLEEKITNGAQYQIDGTTVWVKASNEASPYPTTSLPLTLIIKDAAGGIIAEAPMLKIKVGQ